MYGEKDEINAHGCQANGTGMGGLGDAFPGRRMYSHGLDCPKCLLLLSHLIDSVCSVCRMVLVMFSTMQMKGRCNCH